MEFRNGLYVPDGSLSAAAVGRQKSKDTGMFFSEFAGLPIGWLTVLGTAAIQWQANGIYLHKSLTTNGNDVHMGGGRINNVGAPDSDDDAVPKSYVDGIVKGMGSPIYFEASGTFTKATYGARAYLIDVVGAGGGGGGALDGAGNASAGGGGGAGCLSRSFLLASALAASETVTVGAGGTAGAASGGSVAGTGGFSSFGTLVKAFGGLGGTCRRGSANANVAEGGASGNAGNGTGDFRVSGEGGNPGYYDPNSNAAYGGNGGSSPIGGGGRGGQPRPGVADEEAGTRNSRGYGSGGGGSAALVGGASTPGPAGADGIVIVVPLY